MLVPLFAKVSPSISELVPVTNADGNTDSHTFSLIYKDVTCRNDLERGAHNDAEVGEDAV